MRERFEEDDFCAYCGYKHGEENPARCLRAGTILNEKYLIGKVLGEGGFGITYIAYDTILEKRIAIKEYFPSELVTRDTTTGLKTVLSVLSSSCEEPYQKGLKRFAREAENLAKFNSFPGIVSIMDLFYENNTAYMVMEYIDGMTLSRYLDENGGSLPYTQVLEMMEPVLDSLQTMHSVGIIHRDISPDNIMVTKNGEMKLIDFGAARFVGNNDAKSLTVILKHGYAPPEQYQSDGEQGPWTDIYALSATMYRMITGIVPQAATDRVIGNDRLADAGDHAENLPSYIAKALNHGMALNSRERVSSVKDLEEELNGRKKTYNKTILIAAAAGVFVLITAIIVLLIFGGRKEDQYDSNEDAEKEENVFAEQKNDADTNEDRKQEPTIVLSEKDIRAKYKEFFYDNFDIGNQKEYYVYFADLTNDGTEECIVVNQEYEEKPYIIMCDIRDKLKCCNIFIYTISDASVKQLYNDRICENGRRESYSLTYGDSGAYQLVKSIFEETERNFEVVELSDEKSYEYRKEYESVNCIDLCSTRNKQFDSVIIGYGINVCYNHDYRYGFDDEEGLENIESIKHDYKRYGDGDLIYVANEDLDGDGAKEQITVWNKDIDIEGWYGGPEYKVYISEDEKDTLLYSNESYSSIIPVIVRFGREYGVLLERGVSGTEGAQETALYVYSRMTDEYHEYSSYFIEADRGGNIYTFGYNRDGYEFTYGGDSSGCGSMWHLNYINEELVEYDMTEISEEDLERFENVQNARTEGEKILNDDFIRNYIGIGDEINIKSKITKVLYSGDDRIYIIRSYYCEDESFDWLCNDFRGIRNPSATEIYSVEKGVMTFIGYENGGRKMTSERGIKSYRTDLE